MGSIDDGLANSQTQPGAASLTISRGVTSVERFKDERQRLRLDTASLIFDLHLHPASLPDNRDTDLRAGLAMLYRVEQQVRAKDLAVLLGERNRNAIERSKYNRHAA